MPGLLSPESAAAGANLSLLKEDVGAAEKVPPGSWKVRTA
jgi:hypothetical protein